MPILRSPLNLVKLKWQPSQRLSSLLIITNLNCCFFVYQNIVTQLPLKELELYLAFCKDAAGDHD